MFLQDTLPLTAELTPARLERFSQLIDPAWIEHALQHTGKVTLRRRRLPAEQLVWLVIGLALFRDEPIWHIVRQLDLALSPEDGLIAPSAAIQGRKRLGDAPMERLFRQLANAWCTPKPKEAFGGLCVLAVDGVVLNLPDTPENRATFEGSRSQYGEGDWPQLRATCLMDTETHLIRSAAFGAYSNGELSYARELIQDVPDDSLTVFDRAYYSAAFLLDWQQAGSQRHWLMRAKTPLCYEVIQRLGEGDAWVRLPVSSHARRARPDLPRYWEARLIECREGDKVRRYLTSLADVGRHPAMEVVACYQSRWEIELCYREMKHSLLNGNVPLRSKRPELVRQEMWGVLIAYNLIRQEMKGMAADLGVSPLRLSFQWLAHAIVSELRSCPLETPGTLPQRLSRLREQARWYLLPPRRERAYPRVVKRRTVKYPIE